ncbi:12001_t:CDS:1, partial [Gigaspora margarita]
MSRSLFPLTPKAVSTDSVETNDINMNNEVDSSLLYPVRRIRFGG